MAHHVHDEVAVEVGCDHHVKLLRVADQLHACVIDNHGLRLSNTSQLSLPVVSDGNRLFVLFSLPWKSDNKWKQSNHRNSP